MHRHRILGLLLGIFPLATVQGGCGGTVPPPEAQARAPGGSSHPGGAGVLGTINGRPVTAAELPRGIRNRIMDVQNEMMQRTFHLQWAGFEELVEQAALEAHAKERGMTVADLREAEITQKVTPATDEEARAFYDQHESRIGAPYEVVAPHIKRQITEQRIEEAEAAFLEEIRREVQVDYALTPPNLPRYPVEDGGAPALGRSDAPVTIVEFSDFQCPYCAEARLVVKKLVELYPNDVRLVYRDFPLSQHKEARPAAEAAQCAHEQGKFWPYHDLLFDNPGELQAEDLRKYAQEVELDLGSFEQCVKSERVKERVRAHERAAQAYGVQGTPAIFVNGMKLIGLLPLPLLRALIENELAARPNVGGAEEG